MNDPSHLNQHALGGARQQAHDLQATQKLLQATLDSSTDLIQVFQAVRNQQGHIVDFVWLLNNQAAQKIYGEVVGKSLLQVQSGVVEEGLFETFKHVVETGLPQLYEKHYVHEPVDGWSYQSVVKLNDGVAMTTADITPRKIAQQQLQQSQTFLQSVIDSSLDVIQVFKAVRDETGSVLDFIWVMNNQKAIAQNGQVIGQSLLTRSPGVVPTGIFDRMVEVVQTGIAYEKEQYYNYEQFDGWFYQALVKTDDGVAMTTRNITQAKQAEQQILRLKEEAAQAATDKYRTLFDSIDEGIAIVEIFADQGGQVTDLIWREANPGVERHTGMGGWVGKRASEVVPHLEPDWLDALTNVYQTGQPVRLEAYSVDLDRWIDTYYSRVGGSGSSLMAAVFRDITDRKRQERQQQYLLTLSDALADTSDPIHMEEKLTAITRAYFDADRCYYCTIEGDNAVIRRDAFRGNLPSVAATYPWSSFALFKKIVEKGDPLIVDDAHTTDVLDEALRQLCIQLEVISFLDVPVVKGGNVAGVLCLVQSTPRTWTQAEIQLAREAAERVWAAVERAKAEDALRYSQKRFESIANLVPDLLWDSNPDGSTTWYNQRWLEYTGQRFDQAIDWGWTEAIHPDDREASVRRYREAVAGSQPMRLEERIRRHDGEYRWFVVSAAPLKDERGRVVRMYGAATDIHESKQAGEALQQREAELARVQQIGRIGGVDIDVANQLTGKRSPEYLRLHGLPADTQSERHEDWLRRLHADDRGQAEQTLRSALEGDQSSYESEYRIIRPNDGRLVWIYAKMDIERNAAGRPVRLVGVHIDITRRKLAEEALQEADRRKDEFLAMLAHELRNPMSTIRSGLQILRLVDAKDELSSHTVEMMNRQTDHLVRMVDDLLDVSRISRGKIELKTERVNLVEVVSQAVDSARSLYQEQGKSLQVELPADPIYLEGDATRLTQVVANLLTNGTRYTAEQGQVWLSLTHKPGMLDRQEAILQVRDNGIGLTAQQLTTIFELFVQVDNSTARTKGGLGLGLTLVKRLVEMHGGRVEAQSQGLGQGSTFTVHLPMSAATAEPTPTATLQATNPAPAKRILVIDDNADAAFTLAMLLNYKGYEAHTRHSGQSGIEAAESLQPWAILLDIGMPGMDGYETCRSIRQQPWGQTVVVIALTGYGQDEDRQRTREAGFDGHLVKPVDVGELTKMLTDSFNKE